LSSVLTTSSMWSPLNKVVQFWIISSMQEVLVTWPFAYPGCCRRIGSPRKVPKGFPASTNKHPSISLCSSGGAVIELIICLVRIDRDQLDVGLYHLLPNLSLSLIQSRSLATARLKQYGSSSLEGALPAIEIIKIAQPNGLWDTLLRYGKWRRRPKNQHKRRFRHPQWGTKDKWLQPSKRNCDQWAQKEPVGEHTVEVVLFDTKPCWWRCRCIAIEDDLRREAPH